MSKLRLAAVLAVAPLALSSPAHAQTILSEIVQNALNGCYGAGVTVCDPHVSENPVKTTRTGVPVCTGSCQTVYVPVPGFSGENLCVAWTDHTGDGSQVCALPDPQ